MEEKDKNTDVYNLMVAFVSRYWFGNQKQYSNEIHGCGVVHSYDPQYHASIKDITSYYLDALGRHMCQFRYSSEILQKYMDAYFRNGFEVYDMEYCSHILQAAYVIKLMPIMIDCGFAAYKSGEKGVFCGDGSGIAAHTYSVMTQRETVVVNEYDWSFFYSAYRVHYRQEEERHMNDVIEVFTSFAKSSVLSLKSRWMRGHIAYRSIYIPITVPVTEEEEKCVISEPTVRPFDVPVVAKRDDITDHMYGQRLAVNMLWKVKDTDYSEYIGSGWHQEPEKKDYDAVLLGHVNGPVADFGQLLLDVGKKMKPSGKVFLFSPDVSDPMVRPRVQLLTDSACARKNLHSEGTAAYGHYFSLDQLLSQLSIKKCNPVRFHNAVGDPLRQAALSFDIPTTYISLATYRYNRHSKPFFDRFDPWVANWLKLSAPFGNEIRQQTRLEWYEMIKSQYRTRTMQETYQSHDHEGPFGSSDEEDDGYGWFD